MKCENCPADVSKLYEVEVANATNYDFYWICEDCYTEAQKENKLGYVRKTGKIREKK